MTKGFDDRRIDTVTLTETLPQVFVGSESEGHVAASQVWLRTLSLTRPGRYMIEAESGTGKSSLCSYIYGDRCDYRGVIAFNGVDIRGFGIDDWCRIRRRHIALLPQEMRLFPELTVIQNILIKNRLTDRYSHAEITRMLAAMEVDGKAGQPAGRLSVGQQQRVAIVRALCQPFDFIILDEPVSHLDSRNNKAAAALITEVADANDAGIITTSVGNPLALPEARHIKL